MTTEQRGQDRANLTTFDRVEIGDDVRRAPTLALLRAQRSARLAKEHQDAADELVRLLGTDFGVSWRDIGSELGISHAAAMRWADRAAARLALESEAG